MYNSELEFEFKITGNGPLYGGCMEVGGVFRRREQAELGEQPNIVRFTFILDPGDDLYISALRPRYCIAAEQCALLL